MPLNDYQPVPDIAGVFLPAGLEEYGFGVTIVLRARDAMGAESAPVHMATVVSWPVLEDEAAVSGFVNDKAGAADDALANGDTDTTQQLISGTTALLNSMSAPANATEGGGGRRLLAATALRRSSESGLDADELASRKVQRRKLLATSRSAMDLTVSSTGSLARASQMVSRIWCDFKGLWFRVLMFRPPHGPRGVIHGICTWRAPQPVFSHYWMHYPNSHSPCQFIPTFPILTRVSNSADP